MSEIIELLNATGGAIPLQVTTINQTNWTQFSISLVIAAIGSFFIFYLIAQMLKGNASTGLAGIQLRLIKRNTGRHILMIKHTMADIFNMSMINQETLRQISLALHKFKGKPFDLVLHTPGGEIFSAMFISRILKNYPGEIRVFVPMFAMSGGTLLALSGNQIYMNRTACLGPIDPQLGNLFKFGSAKSWDKILKFKGKKADDQSISFAFTGAQYTKTMRAYVNDIIDFDMSDRDRKTFSKFLTSGEVEHAFPLTINELRAFGIPIKILSSKISKKLLKVISYSGFEGVTFV